MRHLTYGRLFSYLFLEYGRSRKAMELGSRIDNQLFAIFITLARVESSFQAKDEQVYSAADWLTR